MTTVKDIFDEARGLEVSAQETYVRRRCHEDARLADQVLGLLRTFRLAGDFLNSPLAEPASSIGTLIDSSETHERSDGVIGRYELLDLIGEGGFGSVFRAEQREPVKRTVALKIIKLGMDTRQVIARFEQERQALALMDHPNIAKVLDAGATDTGRPYFVMELVRGDPLTRYCDANRLGIKERLSVFTQVCHAVQHAHQKGIIHRDIKPTNILVTRADGKPVPKVIDFGIAKATGPRLTEMTLITDQRALIGTPEYMSPEQAEGGVDIDTRTDIYSLGVLLYELLTGVTPFEPARLRSAPWGELQRIIREDEPPRPSTRLSAMPGSLTGIATTRGVQPARLPAQIRGDLDWIVMKCLDKDRARRYETASGLAMDISRHLAGEPVHAAPPGTLYRVGKFLRRRRAAVIAASLVALSMLAAVAGTTTFALREARRARETERVADFQARMLSDIAVPALGDDLRQDILTEAEASWSRQRLDDDEIERRRDELVFFLTDSNFTNTAIKNLDRIIFAPSVKAIDRDYPDQPLVRAKLLQRVAETCRRLSLLDRAASAQDEALRIRTAVLGRTHPDTLESLYGMARIRVDQRSWNEALPRAREAMELTGRVFGEYHARTVDAVYLLARVLQRGPVESGEEAERDLRRIWEWQRSTLGENDRRTLVSQYRLGQAIFCQENNRFHEAAAITTSSSARLLPLLTEDDPIRSIVLRGVATITIWQGRLADAEEILRDLVPLLRRQQGDDNANTWGSTADLGDVLAGQGRLSEAEPLLEDAISNIRRILGPRDAQTLLAMETLAHLRQRQGRLAEAESLLREALAGRNPAQPGVWLGRPDLPLSLALTLDKTGEPEKVAEAARLRAKCLDIFTAELGEQHPRTFGTMGWVAWNLYLSGRASDAEPLARKAVQGFRDVQVTDPSLAADMMDAVGTLAFILRDTGRPGEALPLFEEIRRTRGPEGSVKHLLAMETWVGHAQCLLMLNRFADAEHELLECTKALSATGWRNLPIQVTKEFVTVYDAWHAAELGAGHDAQAAEWRRRLPANADRLNLAIPVGWGG